MRVCTAPCLLLLAIIHVQGAAPQRLIREAVSNRDLRTLVRNTHPLARPQFDRGAAPDSLPMDRMLLTLSRSADQNAAVEALLLQQQDPSSPQYHHWLTPDEFGAQFGAADSDIQTVTDWLRSFGFQVNRVSKGRSVIEFSGNAGQVSQAFHTSIHKYVVNGVAHWANASDPQIPAALAPVVAGVTTLHNFAKQSLMVPTGKTFEATISPGGGAPQLTASDGTHALGPGDYAVIYGISQYGWSTGFGTTIAVVGRSNINISDVTQFRTFFGLEPNPPVVVVNGPDPGNLGGGEEGEAVLDVTWAGAVAQSAAVKLVVSASTNTSDGVDLSEEYIIDNNLGDVMTESFGSCEANFTQAEAQFHSSLAQQAAAQGISYTVASGDSGTAGCSYGADTSSDGRLSVNLLASNPYVTAVGGTQFDEAAGGGVYWNPSPSSIESAFSYIPEDVWNESCTGGNCPNGDSPGLWASGGGASSVYAKPWWQTGVAGIPNDGARDVPDVALTAAGHDAYLLCLDGSCTPDSRGRISFRGDGGTSAATPSFAGILALIKQSMGARLGLANILLYRLAARDINGCTSYGHLNSVCTFNDITTGNNSVPGQAGYGTAGATYSAGTGYDLATGLGSVNVANLIAAWGPAAAQVAQIRAHIDAPANGTVILGAATFSGWALDDGGVITSVMVSVDNVPQGNATYGVARPDVCSAYPGRPGCPNVGWSYSVDSTLLASGPHTMEITVKSSSGRVMTTSSNFTVENWASVGNPVHIGIDSPGPNATVSDLMPAVGWAFSDAGTVSSVAVLVDGTPYGMAVYGDYRPDVCRVFSSAVGCPVVGWHFTIDTTLFPDGPHTLTIAPALTGGLHSPTTTSFTIANQAPNLIALFIDRPDTQTVYSGVVTFGGWALPAVIGTIETVSVTVDGIPYGNAVYGTMRADVCIAHPGQRGCPNVGWTIPINTAQLANGVHTLKVTASEFSGTLNTTVSRTFQVQNATPTTAGHVFIDQPAPNAPVLGATAFAGWALDDVSGIGTVTIFVDGVRQGTATYGSARGDVCAVYPVSPNCPNVGWTYAIDTTLLTDGPHTLTVTAAPATLDGEQWTATTTFTVANWSGTNPMRIAVDVPNGSQSVSGTLNFGGWALDDLASMDHVSVAVDGVSYGRAAYGGGRPDVCAVYSGRANCPNAGWTLPFNTVLLADGNHTLTVTGTTNGGRSSTVSRSFSTNNAGSDPIRISIDRPSPGTALTSVAAIGGWALDTNAGISIASVQILVDETPVTTADYGASRPDVCAIYGGMTGCPNVGWNALLDTTMFVNGTHNLEVRATTTTGQQLTVSNGFTVANQP